MREKIRQTVKNFISNKYVEIFIFVVIIVSVVLIFVEVGFFARHYHTLIQRINTSILYFFMAELFLRFLASKNFKDFISHHWLDFIALIPFLRIFRVLGFLRLFRVLSLVIFLRRHLRAFTLSFKVRLTEYLIISVVIFFVVIFATTAFMHFEKTDMLQGNQAMQKAFWITLFSLFAGEYHDQFPRSLGGKIVIMIVSMAGMGLFAVLTGTVSAVVIERLKEDTMFGKFNFQDLENHIIICGWNDHVPKIISELQSYEDYKNRDYVVIAEISELPDMSNMGVDMTSVYFIKQDFIKIDVLKFANLEHASVAIIVCDTTGGQSDYNADARTVLTAMTIEKINPKIYTCAELVHPENETHLKISKVDSVVLSSNLSAYMITQASMKSIAVPFYNELLSPTQGNQIYEAEIPDEFTDKKYSEQLPLWKSRFNALLVSKTKRGQTHTQSR